MVSFVLALIMPNRESVQKLQIKRGFSIFKFIILNSPQCYVKSTTWGFNLLVMCFGIKGFGQLLNYLDKS